MSSSTTTASAPRNRRRILINAAIVFLLVAPLLCATAWMWAMWDPSHYLKDVKLAVVNEDTGVTQEGQKVNYGDDVVQGLLGTDYLNFSEVDTAEANEGLREGEYMLVLSIPKNFSTDVITVIHDHPRQPEVMIHYNDHYGTNTPLLTSGLVPGIQQGIAAGIAEGYGAQILDGMNQLGSGLKEAADGAGQLDDGAAQLKAGTEQGIDGTIQLDNGAAELRDGAAQLKDGTGQLLDGAVQLDNGMSELRAGTGQLGDGAAQIDSGVGELTGALIPLLRQVGTVAEGLAPVINAMENLGMMQQAAQLRELTALVDNNNPGALANQLQMLKDGTAEMSYNLNDPSAPYLSGVLQLKDGTTQLRNGAAELDNGAGQLHDGTIQLKDGTAQMKDGTYQLDDGVRQLKDGTSQLNTGLSEGAKQAPEISDIQASSHQIAVPVTYAQDYRHPVQTLADMQNPTSKILSGGVTLILVLVFGFMLMALISMVAPDILGLRQRYGAVRGVLSGFTLVAGINFALLGLLTLAGRMVDFHTQRPLVYTAVLMLLAANGTAGFQLLRLAFGKLVGGVIALAYFAYGVFCFGGVWPVQLTPAPLRALHHLHPMSYARDAYIRTVDNNLDGTFYTAIIALIIFTVVFLGLSVVVRSHHIRKEAELDEADAFSDAKEGVAVSGGAHAIS